MIDQLFRAAMFNLGRGEFEAALISFDAIMALGDRRHEVLLGAAVCREQTGDDEGCRELLELVQRRSILDGRPISAELVDAMRPWLPGGAKSRTSRDALSKSANRMRPKLT